MEVPSIEPKRKKKEQETKIDAMGVIGFDISFFIFSLKHISNIKNTDATIPEPELMYIEINIVKQNIKKRESLFSNESFEFLFDLRSQYRIVRNICA